MRFLDFTKLNFLMWEEACTHWQLKQRINGETRDIVKSYINAKHREEIIFTKGATEAINCSSQYLWRKIYKNW